MTHRCVEYSNQHPHECTECGRVPEEVVSDTVCLFCSAMMQGEDQDELERA